MSNNILPPIAAPAPKIEAKLPAIERAKDKKSLEKAAKDFETMFMDIVIKSMRDTVPDSELTGGSENIKIFQQMLDSEYAKNMTHKGEKGLGLSEAIVRQLSPQLKEGVQKNEN